MKKAYKNIKPGIETPKLSFETYRQVYNWPGILSLLTICTLKCLSIGNHLQKRDFHGTLGTLYQLDQGIFYQNFNWRETIKITGLKKNKIACPIKAVLPHGIN